MTAQFIGRLTGEQWILLAAATTQLGLGVLAATSRGSNSSALARHVSVLCFTLFGWNSAGLAHQLTAHSAFRAIDRGLSPWSLVATAALIAAFVGRRRSTRTWRRSLGVMASIASVLAVAGLFWSSDGSENIFEGAWAAVLLCTLLLTLGLGVFWLVGFRRAAGPGTERDHATRLLVALAGGLALGLTDLLDELGLQAPSLGSAGTLFAAVVSGPLILRDSPLGTGRSVRGVLLAMLCVSVVVMLYVSVFVSYGATLSALVLALLILTIVLLVYGGFTLRDLLRHAEGRRRLVLLGRMASQMAHDLKNPLAAIAGAADVIQGAHERGSGDAPTLASQMKLVGLISEQATKMNHLIDVYGRIGALKPDNRVFSLDELVQGAIGAVSASTPRPSSSGLVHGEHNAFGDPSLLGVALENLLVNAQQSGATTVDVEVSRDRSHTVLVVRDNGPGMNPRVAEMAFEEFFTTKETGSGLGLSFVQRILHAHGGTASIESIVGKGTAVTLRLPESS